MTARLSEGATGRPHARRGTDSPPLDTIGGRISHDLAPNGIQMVDKGPAPGCLAS